MDSLNNSARWNSISWMSIIQREYIVDFGRICRVLHGERCILTDILDDVAGGNIRRIAAIYIADAVGVLCTHERQERSSIAAVSSAAKAARRPAAREAAAVRRLAAPLTGVSRQQAS